MRLLVIEDYSPLRESLAKGLRELGYAVDATGDGSEGSRYVADHLYDAVVLDLMLPGLAGLDLLRELRAGGSRVRVDGEARLGRRPGRGARPRRRRLPGQAVRVRGARARLRAWSAGATFKRTRWSGWPTSRSICASAARIARARAITLSAREFALLEYLASRCGEVVRTRT